METNPGHHDGEILYGGFGPTEEATQGFVILCYQLKNKVQEITGKNYEKFQAISFRAQLVAGMNFIVKVLVGGENYIHMKFFWALPFHGGGVTVMSVQENKTKTEAIEPF